jgi:hypothetical protein
MTQRENEMMSICYLEIALGSDLFNRSRANMPTGRNITTDGTVHEPFNFLTVEDHGRGLFVGLITHPQTSYRVWCVCV